MTSPAGPLPSAPVSTSTDRPSPLRVLDLAQTRAAAVLAGVGEGDWDRPTPCADWSVRDVANKLTASTLVFAAFGRREAADPSHDLVHPAEILGDDALGTYLSAAAECRAAWRRDGALDGTAPSTQGEFGAVAVLNARIFDTTVLTTDVARACGLDPLVDGVQAAYVLRVARALVPLVRERDPQRYAPAVDAAGADGDPEPLAELLAVTGRDPHWRTPVR